MNQIAPKRQVLLLAGTAEARELAQALAQRDQLDVTASLAGATANPADYPVPIRVGGFGGAQGLATWLKAHSTDIVIDATHPFAISMSRNAALAARQTNTSLIRLERPAWSAGPGDNWLLVPSLRKAILTLPAKARTFLATGKGSVDELAQLALQRSDIWCALRLIDTPQNPFPLPQGRYVQGRPPFSVAHERALFEDLAITHLVTKNAGGPAGRAKLTAARDLGLAVLMVERPRVLEGQEHIVETVDDVLELLEQNV